MRLAAILLLVFTSVAAQAQQMLRGRVLGTGSQPVAGAAIVVLHVADSSFAQGGLSEEDGRFAVRGAGKAGEPELVRIQAVGYTTQTIKADKADLGDILLASRSTQMKEVTITADKPFIEAKADMMVVNVEGSIVAQGNSALELLRKSPGVVVDKDDNLTLKGKPGIRVLIDGKPSPLSGADLASYLRSLQAQDIEAIELISNPSAKYEAAGSAGVINIRLKKNRNFGTNGSVTAGYTQGIFPKYTQGLRLNHRNKRINVFGSIGADEATYRSSQHFERYQADSIYDQRVAETSTFRSVRYKAGADYFINSKHTVGIQANGLASASTQANEAVTNIMAQAMPTGAETRPVNRYLVARSTGTGSRPNLNGNLNYRYVDTSGHELTADLDYGGYRLRSQNTTPNQYYNGARQPTSLNTFRITTPTRIDLYSAKADYEQKLLGGKLAAGWRTGHVETDNDFRFENVANDAFVYDTARSNRFRYTETIHALYSQYKRDYKKWGYQAGLRAEYTDRLGRLTSETTLADESQRRVHQPYMNLFPSGGLSYNPNGQNSLSLTYSRRIDRPSYQSLNPFENKIDELTYQKGNPFLNPQFTNTLELSHTYKSFLTSSINYSHVRDMFANLTDTIEGRRSYDQNRNLATADFVSLTVSAPLSFGKYSGFINVNGFAQNYRADYGAGKRIDITAYTLNIYQQHSYKITPRVTAEVSGWYASPGVYGGTFKNRAMGGIDAGLQYMSPDKRFDCKLAMTDLAQTMRWSGTQDFGGLRLIGSGQWESRTVRVTMSYRFGSSQVKEARQRKGGSDDLGSRVK